MENTIKLIETLKKNSFVTEGKICTSSVDGVRYRYDQYVLKYNHCASWLVSLFDKAAKENNATDIRQFTSGKFSFYCEKAKYVGQPHGKIIFKELIELK